MIQKGVKNHMKELVWGLYFTIMIVSCKPENLVMDAPIRLVEPMMVSDLQRDSSFNCNFPEVMSCVYMNILQDSLLLLHDTPVSDRNLYFYKIYSLLDYSYLGECVRKGRGPDEFLEPMISGNLIGMNGNMDCYIYDLSQNKSFRYDLSQLMSGHDSNPSVTDLPDMTVYAAPYRDSLQFVMNVDKRKLLCNIIDKDGEVVKSINLYSDNIDAKKHISQLGNCILVNDRAGIVALMMLSLPQINYMEVESGKIHSSAVDVRYKQWKQAIKASAPKQLMAFPQYYNDATSSDNYIMGVYLARSINDLISGKKLNPHIHIFDWEGNFMYDLRVHEPVSNIEYDADSGFLYGLDVSKGQIYRYDLSDMLKVKKKN